MLHCRRDNRWRATRPGDGLGERRPDSIDWDTRGLGRLSTAIWSIGGRMTSPCSQLAAASASAELPRSIAMAALLLLLGTLPTIAGYPDEAHSP